MMKNILCVDWGNSFVKLAVFNQSDVILANIKCTEDEVEHQVAILIATHAIQGAIVSTVSQSSAALEQMLSCQMSFYMTLNSQTSLPIMNAYSSSETLGADRLAMAVGAHSLYPNTNILAIGLGTCITYNFVHKNKAYRGGAISPGLNMRLKAMHEFTNQLPQVSVEGELLLLGYDTETCIRSGAVHGMAAEIDGMIIAYSAQYSDFNAVLTGGDAAFFANKLKSKIFADPDLILKGLNIILKYNVPQLR